MRQLQKLQSKIQKLGVGLMSGTSVDGVDAALVNIQNNGLEIKRELVHFLTFPYPDGIKETILDCSIPGRGSVDKICRLNFLLGEVFAEAVMALLDTANIKRDQVDFIGSHGQTVHHLPEEKQLFDYKIKSTLQLGEPSVIAKRTGIVTVADFRPADLALGGQGAPLVPYFDYVMFRSAFKNRALLNIGGIANLTVLKKNGRIEEIIALDTGPGNMVIDALMRKMFRLPFDKDGQIAQTGQVSLELLLFALSHPYFKKHPPKSTGREQFGTSFCEELFEKSNHLDLKSNDIIVTASEITAHTIWQAYQHFVAPIIVVDELIVSGGGSNNLYLMESLRQKADNMFIKRIDEYGIPTEAKEAVCFALLANETLSGNDNNVPDATGAKHPTILGKICL